MESHTIDRVFKSRPGLDRREYSRADLEHFAQHGFDGPDSARLPSGPFLAYLDRFIDVSRSGGSFGCGAIVADHRITGKEWFFEHHFPGQPVMPGALQIDALAQLLGALAVMTGVRGRQGMFREVAATYKYPITPQHERILYQVELTQVRETKGITQIFGQGRVDVDGRRAATAKKLVVVFV